MRALAALVLVLLPVTLAAAHEDAEPLVAHLPGADVGDFWRYTMTAEGGNGSVVSEVVAREKGEDAALLVERVVLETEGDSPAGHVRQVIEQRWQRRVADLAVERIDIASRAHVTETNKTFTDANTTVTYEPPLARFPFPFRAGDDWRVRSTETTSREGAAAPVIREHVQRFAALREEHVTVEAGTFDALVVEARDESGRAPPGALERLWWAPEACNYVKLESVRDGEVLAVQELEAYACSRLDVPDPGEASASIRRLEARGSPAAGAALLAALLLLAAAWRRR